MKKYNIRVGLAPAVRRDGGHTIRVRVSWEGNRIDINLPCSIPADQWDNTTQRPKPKYISSDMRTTAASITSDINSVIAEVDNRFARARIEGRMPSRNEIADGFVGGAKKSQAEADSSVLHLMKVYVADMERTNGWQYNTSKHFTTIATHIEKYDRTANISDVNERWLEDLSAHLVSCGLQNATTNTMLTRFKWFLRWCQKRGYNVGAFDDFKPRLKGADKPVIYLTIEELHAIMEHDYATDSMPHLNNVRDVFVMQCATGLRYSDISRLSWSMIYDDSIHITTKKTATPLKIELNDISRSIIDRYRPFAQSHENGDGLVLHIISNQKYNIYLKDVCRLANIDTPITITTINGAKVTETTHKKWELVTTHVGRKTFVVTMLTAGADPLSVMKFTGHRNYKTMEPYIDISERHRRAAMDAFDKFTKKDIH